MKLIKPSYTIIPQEEGIEGIYKQIELAGRTCYKSEHLIQEGSAKKFVDRLINLGHTAVLEQGTVYLYYSVPKKAWANRAKNSFSDRYYKNPYSKVNYVWDEETQSHQYYITTNYRVLVQNNWLDDLKYLYNPTEHHEKRICVRFICDRGILAEFTRHRVFSFCAESSRYCNYSLGKFNNEVTFIIPCWMNLQEGYWRYDSSHFKTYYSKDSQPDDRGIVFKEALSKVEDAISSKFIQSLHQSEDTYFSLLREGWKPEQARAVLPNALKTELVMTGFESDWEYFFSLRCSSNAHPQARELAIPFQEALNNMLIEN